jgi:hypothetical protein
MSYSNKTLLLRRCWPSSDFVSTQLLYVSLQSAAQRIKGICRQWKPGQAAVSGSRYMDSFLCDFYTAARHLFCLFGIETVSMRTLHVINQYVILPVCSHMMLPLVWCKQNSHYGTSAYRANILPLIIHSVLNNTETNEISRCRSWITLVIGVTIKLLNNFCPVVWR